MTAAFNGSLPGHKKMAGLATHGAHERATRARARAYVGQLEARGYDIAALGDDQYIDEVELAEIVSEEAAQIASVDLTPTWGHSLKRQGDLAAP